MFDVCDVVTWKAKDGRQLTGTVACVVPAGTDVPDQYLSEGCTFRAKRARWERVIVDTGLYISNIGLPTAKYFAVNTGNPTLTKVELDWQPLTTRLPKLSQSRHYHHSDRGSTGT